MLTGRKKLLIAGILAAAVAMAGCGKKDVPETETAAMTETVAVETETETEAETETEPETKEALPEGKMYSFITGEVIDEEEGMKRPVAVMISNIKDALPQSGLSKAGILYEAVVESDITRMMAVFESTESVGDSLGSVRSSRHYYLDFAHDEEAIYTHYGWSFVAQDRITNEGIKTINMMYAQPGSCYIRTKDRVAPHNVFTSGAMIDKGIDMFGIERQLPENYEGRLKFNTSDQVIESGQDAYTVDIPFSSKCQLTYDEDNKVYMKYEYGDKHMDAAENVQLSFKNIIIQKAAYSGYPNDPILKEIQLTGSGEGYYISDGKAVKITWKKDDLNDHTRYYLEDGTQLSMNQGHTYIAVVPNEYNITISGK